jgi:peptidyl-prolyl cis-trans isomerase SurA
VLRTSVKLAAVALAAGVAVSACGSVQLGAAAVTNSQRISSATVTNQVADLNSAYQADRKKLQITLKQAQMPRDVLTWLLRFQVRDRQAQRAGVNVTGHDVQEALGALSASVKQQSPTATLTEVAVANGIPPDLKPELGRYQAIETKLLAQLDGGKTPTGSAAQRALQAQFTRSQCLAAKDLDIRVNPQFGALNYSQVTVVPAPPVLSAAPASSPTATADLKPSC